MPRKYERVSKQSLYKYTIYTQFIYIFSYLYTEHCNIAVNFISPPVIIYLGQLKNKLKFKFFPFLPTQKQLATLKRATTPRCKLNVIALPTTEAPMKTETEQSCPPGPKMADIVVDNATHIHTAHTHTHVRGGLA